MTSEDEGNRIAGWRPHSVTSLAAMFHIAADRLRVYEVVPRHYYLFIVQTEHGHDAGLRQMSTALASLGVPGMVLCTPNAVKAWPISHDGLMNMDPSARRDTIRGLGEVLKDICPEASDYLKAYE